MTFQIVSMIQTHQLTLLGFQFWRSTSTMQQKARTLYRKMMGAPYFLVAVALISSGTMASISATSITLTVSSQNSASTKAPDIFQPLAETTKCIQPQRTLRCFVCQLTGSCLGCSLDSEDNEGCFSPMRTPPSAEKYQAGDHPSQSFELGKSLSYYARKGMVETVVYEGASPDSMSHTIR